MTLTTADLNFIHQVAAHHASATPAQVDDRNVEAAAAWPDSTADGKPSFTTPFQRAAALAEAVMRVYPVASTLTGLFVTFAALRVEGFQLAAPQGVLAGMIDGMSRERVSVATLAAWLEDRSVPIG